MYCLKSCEKYITGIATGGVFFGWGGYITQVQDSIKTSVFVTKVFFISEVVDRGDAQRAFASVYAHVGFAVPGPPVGAACTS